MDRFSPRVPVVTSHHHVTDWSRVSQNVNGDAVARGSSQRLEDLEARGVNDGRGVLLPYGVDTRAFAASTPLERELTKRQLVERLGALGRPESSA